MNFCIHSSLCFILICNYSTLYAFYEAVGKRNSLVRRAKRAAVKITESLSSKPSNNQTSSPSSEDTTSIKGENQSDSNTSGGSSSSGSSSASTILDNLELGASSPVLIGETINLYHDLYENTQEIKVMSMIGLTLCCSFFLIFPCCCRCDL